MDNTTVRVAAGALAPRWGKLACAIALAAVLAGPAEAYDVKEVGSFYTGGHTVTLSGLPTREIVFTPGSPPVKSDPNGEFQVGQMYVQYVRLTAPTSPLPLLLWHGGGLTGVSFETKPDGKPGWQQYFLSHGLDTYVSDAVERGRASWARFPEIYKTEPFFRSQKEAWPLFRIGPDYAVGGPRTAYGDTRFPIAAFDSFAKEFVPRWATNYPMTQDAYNAEVAQICPCMVLMHSQGASFGFNAALAAPDKVKAVVAVEASGFPDVSKVDLSTLKNTPHLFIYGDHMVGPFWEKVHANAKAYADALSSAGVPVDFIDLPATGIQGNSHMLMMDENSDEIAGLILDWLHKHKT